MADHPWLKADSQRLHMKDGRQLQPGELPNLSGDWYWRDYPGYGDDSPAGRAALDAFHAAGGANYLASWSNKEGYQNAYMKALQAYQQVQQSLPVWENQTQQAVQGANPPLAPGMNLDQMQNPAMLSLMAALAGSKISNSGGQ